MKKLFSLITFVVFAAVAVAQTPQAIISRMEAELAWRYYCGQTIMSFPN